MENNIIQISLNKALNGGISGSLAMGFQVGSMMWLRTTLNHQYSHGGTFQSNLKYLYNNGGILRFYKGVIPALFQAPLSRFGDTAANVGMMTYLDSNPDTKNLPIPVKTFAGSCLAGIWRINLMPIDTFKTMKQVHGDNAKKILKQKIKLNGISVLYHGSLGACGATIIGHFPWFLTFNTLSEKIPKPDNDKTLLKMTRYAGIGFCSSFVSDTVSNSARVIKVSKQTNKDGTSYTNIIKKIYNEKGLTELLGRGLKTKIIINGIQGIVFSIVWKTCQEILDQRSKC